MNTFRRAPIHIPLSSAAAAVAVLLLVLLVAAVLLIVARLCEAAELLMVV